MNKITDKMIEIIQIIMNIEFKFILIGLRTCNYFICIYFTERLFLVDEVVSFRLLASFVASIEEYFHDCMMVEYYFPLVYMNEDDEVCLLMVSHVPMDATAAVYKCLFCSERFCFASCELHESA